MLKGIKLSEKSYFDYSFQGNLEYSGSIEEHHGAEAITNAVRAWLVSFQGEVLRKPTLGGVLIPLLTKPMSDDIASLIEGNIETSLRTNFNPRVITQEIKVTPNYEGDYYSIYIRGFCPAVRASILLDEDINKLVI